MADGGVGAVGIAARGDAILQVRHRQRLDVAARLERSGLEHEAQSERQGNGAGPMRAGVTTRAIAPQNPNREGRDRRQQQRPVRRAARGGDHAHHDERETNVGTARIGDVAAGDGGAHRPEKRLVVDAVPGAVDLGRHQGEKRHRQPAQNRVNAAGAVGIETDRRPAARSPPCSHPRDAGSPCPRAASATASSAAAR